jgi:hypothetical protein
MRRKDLSKFYDRLTPKERFKLVAEAQARGDERERSQLVQSAPRYTREEPDPAYTGLVKASKDLTWAVCLGLLPSLAKMRMARAFAEILPFICNAFVKHVHVSYLTGRQARAERAWRAAGKEGDPPEETEGNGLEETLEHISAPMQWASEGVTDLPCKLELENAKEARVLWEAFGNFCREEFALEPKKLVLMWCEVALPELEELEALTGDVEPEREEVEKHEALIKEGWLTLVKG